MSETDRNGTEYHSRRSDGISLHSRNASSKLACGSDSALAERQHHEDGCGNDEHEERCAPGACGRRQAPGQEGADELAQHVGPPVHREHRGASIDGVVVGQK